MEKQEPKDRIDLSKYAVWKPTSEYFSDWRKEVEMKYKVMIFQNSLEMEDWLNTNKSHILEYKVAMTDNYLMVVAKMYWIKE